MQREVLITAPFVEPVTLAEAKAHLRVDITDDDAYITALIVAARRVCETLTRQSFVTQTWDFYMDQFPWGGGYFNRVIRQLGPTPYWLPSNTGIIHLPRPPLQSVVFLKYTDFQGNQQTIDPTLYNVSGGTPARIQPVYGKVWPVARPQVDGVQIRMTVGFGNDGSSVPENYKLAMKLLIGTWYENREHIALGAPPARIADTVDLLLAADDPGEYG